MISRERPVDPIEEAALAAGATGRRTGGGVLSGFLPAELRIAELLPAGVLLLGWLLV